MYLKFFICLCFLGGTLATETGNGEDQNLREELKTCLSTVIKELCPDCITVHLVTPMKPSWEAYALASHFWESTPTYASTIYTMDRPGYEDPLVAQVGFYLANSDTELTMALKHLRETNSKRNCVIWVNFHFGRSLSNYLKSTTPATWNLGKGWSIIFVGLKDGEVQVFGTPIQKSRSTIVQSFRNLSLCDTKALIAVSQPLPKVTQSQDYILTVIIHPPVLPFVERETDNPGGLIGNLINVLKVKLNFTPKYDWSYKLKDLPNLREKRDFHILFNALSGPKSIPPSSSLTIMQESIWVFATPNLSNKRNFLAIPFKTNILLHVMLLGIYTGVMLLLSRDLDKTRIMLRLFGIFFGVAVGWFPRKALLRFLVVIWCFTSYILLQAYLAALTSELSAPIISDQIRDTEDLMKSGIKLYCQESLKELYCNLGGNSNVYICEKCVIPDQEWYLQLYTYRTHTKKSWEPFAFQANMFLTKIFLNGKPFHILPERIGMWPSVIDSNLGTQSVETVTKIFQGLYEAGITMHWREKYYLHNETESEDESKMLSMSHLKDIFIILYVGWSVSFFVFVIEILTKWYHKN